MISPVFIVVILIGAAAILRFIGFAEPVGAILGAFAALVLAKPFDVDAFAGVADFTRIDTSYAVIPLLTVANSLLAGCYPAPRPNRPLGWYAPGDPAFIGALFVATVLAAGAFQVTVSGLVSRSLLAGLVLWLAMTGTSGLITRKSGKAGIDGVQRPTGYGLFLLPVIVFLPLSELAAGMITPLEAFAFFAALIAVFRLTIWKGRRIAAFGIDLLRGIADGAWIVLVVFAGQVASDALSVSGLEQTTLALPPLISMVIFAITVLMLGAMLGSTFGALLAAAIFGRLLENAGVGHDTSALVLAVTLMVSYARPPLALHLPSPPYDFTAEGTAPAELGALAAGVIAVVAFSALVGLKS
jgi:TRAP-type C4-dicarboxylate transport system permease large subunit